MIDLSVVVVSYETADRLVECLDSLEAARRLNPALSFEVIVVDNGSRDASVERAGKHPVAPRLVAGLRNRGFAAAVNAGLRLRRGRHVVLLNSDVRVDPNLLAHAVSLLDERPSIGILGPALRHSDGRPQRSVHSVPNWLDEIFPSWIRPSSPFHEIPADDPVVGRTGLGFGYQEVEAVRGAVFFIRGEILDKVGDFDEGYFFFLEETDFCARVRQLGARVAFCPSLRATHALGASSKRRVPLATRIEYHRSLYRFLVSRDGRAATAAVRISRALRSGLTVSALALPALFSFGGLRADVQRRLAERSGLLLWHLRGCPDSPSLSDALERQAPVPDLSLARPSHPAN